MTNSSLTTQQKILFIHGFGSCGTGTKAETLRKHFGHEHFISPDLPVEPSHCLTILHNLITQHQPIATISSSLGSYYANWFNRHQNLPAIVINPAVEAAKTLKPHIGHHQHWCTNEPFELTLDHIKQLENIQRPQIQQKEKYLVLLQQGDEILDYKQAVRFYKGKEIIIEKKGNHRFENLSQYLTIIDQFITSIIKPI